MFVVKDRSLSKSVALEDKAVKECQGQTLKLIRNI
jgi:hypothetical protein